MPSKQYAQQAEMYSSAKTDTMQWGALCGIQEWSGRHNFMIVTRNIIRIPQIEATIPILIENKCTQCHHLLSFGRRPEKNPPKNQTFARNVECKIWARWYPQCLPAEGSAHIDPGPTLHSTIPMHYCRYYCVIHAAISQCLLPFADTMSLKIYFCGSIRAGRADAPLYVRLIEELKAYGTVLTEHVGNQQLLDKG